MRRLILALLVLGWTLPAWATDYPVHDGTALQNAVNSATYGDRILCDAGGSYFVDLLLPDKGTPPTGTDADYILIQPASLAGLPAAGTRVVPATHTAGMCKIYGNSLQPTIRTDPQARYYKFTGVEVTTDGSTYIPNLIDLGCCGSGAGGYMTRAETLLTHHFVIDRSFVHPPEISASSLNPAGHDRSVGRGIHLTGRYFSVTNSYVAGFWGTISTDHVTGIDSYGIFTDAGMDNFTITNNYIGAGFNNIFLGGADMGSATTATLTSATTTSATFSNVTNLHIGDLVTLYHASCNVVNGRGDSVCYSVVKVSNIAGSVVTYAGFGPSGNLPGSPTSGAGSYAAWNGDNIDTVNISDNTLEKLTYWNTSGYGGQWKAFIEVKNANALTINRNLMIGSGYHGAPIAFTVRNQNGAMPWSTISNATVTNNAIYPDVGSFMVNQISDDGNTSGCAFTWNVSNNLVKAFGGNDYGYAFSTPSGLANCGTGITLNHNTIINTGVSSFMVGSGNVMANPSVALTNNIYFNGNYDTNCQISPNTRAACWPGFTENKNVVIDLNNIGPSYPNSAVVTTVASVGFTDFVNGDYSLQSGSPYRFNASDGTARGVNCAALPTGACSGGTAPGAVSDLSATPGNGQIVLAWSDVAGATSYKVKRGTSPGGETLLTTVGTSDYTDSVTNGITYYYKVVASNSAGDSADSNEVSATGTAGGPTLHWRPRFHR